MKYLVRITETLRRDIIVDAENERDAYDMAEDAIVNDGIELDYNDYCDTDIEVLRKASKIDISLYEEIGG